MREHERPSRPVLFFTKESEYPYWGKGSSVFVASDRHVYWITARHVMKNQRASVNDLLITPATDSAISVPFNELVEIVESPENEDFRDIYMLRVDMEQFWSSTDSDLYAWNINRDFCDCSELSIGEELFLLGFPSESRFVNYEEQKIHFTRTVLRAIYEGVTTEEHCHELRLETSVTLDELDGLSGGAVFRHPENPEERIQLVGILIRGTTQSGKARFIDCSVIEDMVRLSEGA